LTPGPTEVNNWVRFFSGKWHLGITHKFHPRSRGFDVYYGLPWSDDMGCVDVKVYNHPQCKTCPWNSSRTVDGGDEPVRECSRDFMHFSNKPTDDVPERFTRW